MSEARKLAGILVRGFVPLPYDQVGEPLLGRRRRGGVFYAAIWAWTFTKGGLGMGRKMVILPGNADPTGVKQYPDEKGVPARWPDGALHETFAREYARRLGCDAIVVHKSGWPQNETSPQTEAVMDLFRANSDIAALYGFSGGGYNVKHILARLAREWPEDFQGIHLVVVLGSPNSLHNGSIYEPSNYDADAEKACRKISRQGSQTGPSMEETELGCDLQGKSALEGFAAKSAGHGEARRPGHTHVRPGGVAGDNAGLGHA